MHRDLVYRLAEGVQVRNEHFGLLFYDYRGPRLYFVSSRQLIDETFFEGRMTVGTLMEGFLVRTPWLHDQVGQQITSLLHKLEEKGLVHGQSLC